MILIYEKEEFKNLPDFFWNYWMVKIKNEIIKTSYPLVFIRVGIGNKEDESEIYQTLWKIKNDKNDATFYDYFEYDGKYVGIALNTIYDYVDLKPDDL